MLIHAVLTHAVQGLKKPHMPLEYCEMAMSAHIETTTMSLRPPLDRILAKMVGSGGREGFSGMKNTCAPNAQGGEPSPAHQYWQPNPAPPPGPHLLPRRRILEHQVRVLVVKVELVLPQRRLRSNHLTAKAAQSNMVQWQ